MNNPLSQVEDAKVANRYNSRGTKSLPRRGQIKSKIVANAFRSIASVIHRASSAAAMHSPREKPGQEKDAARRARVGFEPECLAIRVE
ncbi:hypothetical protein RJT34_02891 [Clitoria ternatea]|uniref:Uncharacterized protein n=1 Tax=Clitoria ternatea TaxID=43366 RepID=A0AAN9KIR7_CLITE